MQKVHLAGHNFLPYLKGEVEKGPRENFIYASETGDIVAIRDGDNKPRLPRIPLSLRLSGPVKISPLGGLVTRSSAHSLI